MNILNILASTSGDIESRINAFSIKTVLVSILILAVLLLISTRIVKSKKLEKLKKPIFILIVLAISVPSLFMTGSTIYLNTVSDSRGPVHWHTDIEFWVCGQEVELRDPFALLSNKIGTSTFHEHDDKRIHLEGVVMDKQVDSSLDKFMRVTGGSIEKSKLVIPTEPNPFESDTDGDVVTGDQELVKQFLTKGDKERTILTVENGQGCSDQGYAEVQVFLYSFSKKDDTYTQTKLEDPKSYTMRDESTVPPGDCLIVEFDQVKSVTDKLCKQFGVRDSVRCVEFGVSAYNPDLCNIQQTNTQRNETSDEVQTEEL